MIQNFPKLHRIKSIIWDGFWIISITIYFNIYIYIPFVWVEEFLLSCHHLLSQASVLLPILWFPPSTSFQHQHFSEDRQTRRPGGTWLSETSRDFFTLARVGQAHAMKATVTERLYWYSVQIEDSYQYISWSSSVDIRFQDLFWKFKLINVLLMIYFTIKFGRLWSTEKW